MVQLMEISNQDYIGQLSELNNSITIQFGIIYSFSSVTLPITYKTYYKIVGLPHNIYENAATISINLYTKNLSNFTCQVRLNGGGTNAPYDWITIGY